jgi:hypothetical protein
MVGHVARIEEMRNTYKIVFGKPEGMRPLGRSKRRWEDNIKMNLKEIGWENVDWAHLGQDRVQRRVVVNKVTNLRFPKKEDNLYTRKATMNFTG